MTGTKDTGRQRIGKPSRLAAPFTTLKAGGCICTGQAAAIADIGTDHGYVPIYLARTLERLKVLWLWMWEKVLWQRADGHISESTRHGRAEGLHAYFHTDPSERRTGKSCRPGEADAVVMAGMGGELEISILEAGTQLWEHIRHVDLYHRSRIWKRSVAIWQANGFFIEDEAMIQDEGKFYTVMKARSRNK